jgi:hypothetical protein
MKTSPFVEVSACREFSCCFLPSLISFYAIILRPKFQVSLTMSNGFASSLEISAQIVRNNDAMTASGQLSRASTTNLPPPAFCINIPVMPMRVPGSHPYRVLMRRDFIPSWLPGICMPVPAMITSDPDMSRTRSDSAVLMDADRGSKFYDDLRICRTEAEGDSDECVQKDFHI